MASRTKQLRSLILKSERKLRRLSKEEAVSRSIWTRAYHVYETAAEKLANLKKHGTKKEGTLQERVLGWREYSAKLTQRRDAARKAMQEEEARLAVLRQELAMALAREELETRATDETVNQVFALNDAVVAALHARNDYLSAHVFRLLVKEDGTLHSQITLDNRDSTRRVRAMVNSITIVRTDLAEQAIDLIESFFDSFQQKADMDEATAALHQLTRKLLDIKTSFKVGPDLYRFLSLELDDELFPSLVGAQRLLKKSLRDYSPNSPSTICTSGSGFSSKASRVITICV